MGRKSLDWYGKTSIFEGIAAAVGPEPLCSRQTH